MPPKIARKNKANLVLALQVDNDDTTATVASPATPMDDDHTNNNNDSTSTTSSSGGGGDRVNGEGIEVIIGLAVPVTELRISVKVNDKDERTFQAKPFRCECSQDSNTPNAFLMWHLPLPHIKMGQKVTYLSSARKPGQTRFHDQSRCSVMVKFHTLGHVRSDEYTHFVYIPDIFSERPMYNYAAMTPNEDTVNRFVLCALHSSVHNITEPMLLRSRISSIIKALYVNQVVPVGTPCCLDAKAIKTFCFENFQDVEGMQCSTPASTIGLVYWLSTTTRSAVPFFKSMTMSSPLRGSDGTPPFEIAASIINLSIDQASRRLIIEKVDCDIDTYRKKPADTLLHRRTQLIKYALDVDVAKTSAVESFKPNITLSAKEEQEFASFLPSLFKASVKMAIDSVASLREARAQMEANKPKEQLQVVSDEQSSDGLPTVDTLIDFLVQTLKARTNRRHANKASFVFESEFEEFYNLTFTKTSEDWMPSAKAVLFWLKDPQFSYESIVQHHARDLLRAGSDAAQALAFEERHAWQLLEFVTTYFKDHDQFSRMIKLCLERIQYCTYVALTGRFRRDILGQALLRLQCRHRLRSYKAEIQRVHLKGISFSSLVKWPKDEDGSVVQLRIDLCSCDQHRYNERWSKYYPTKAPSSDSVSIPTPGFDDEIMTVERQEVREIIISMAKGTPLADEVQCWPSLTTHIKPNAPPTSFVTGCATEIIAHRFTNFFMDYGGRSEHVYAQATRLASLLFCAEDEKVSRDAYIVCADRAARLLFQQLVEKYEQVWCTGNAEVHATENLQEFLKLRNKFSECLTSFFEKAESKSFTGYIVHSFDVDFLEGVSVCAHHTPQFQKLLPKHGNYPPFEPTHFKKQCDAIVDRVSKAVQQAHDSLDTAATNTVLGQRVSFHHEKLLLEDDFLGTTLSSKLLLHSHVPTLVLDVTADIINLPKMRRLDNDVKKWCDQRPILDSDLAQSALSPTFLPQDVLELARKTFRTIVEYEQLRERSVVRVKEQHLLRSLVSKLVHLKLLNANELHKSLVNDCGEDDANISTIHDVLGDLLHEESEFSALLGKLHTQPGVVSNTPSFTKPSPAVSAILVFFQETVATIWKTLHDGIHAAATLCQMSDDSIDEEASAELKCRFQVAHGIWRGMTDWDTLSQSLEDINTCVGEESKRLIVEETTTIEVLRTHKGEIEEAFQTACEASKIHDTPDTTSQIVKDLIQSSKRVNRHRRDIRNAKERHQDAVDDDDDEEEIAARAAAVQKATEELALITGELRIAFHKHYTIISRLFPTEKQALDKAFSLNCEHGAPFDPAASLADFIIESDNGNILYAKQGSEAVVIKRFETHSRFAQECRVYTELHSCHFVAKQRKVFCESGKHYAVMPRYPGGTLHAWVLLHNNDAGAFLRAMSDTCKGLADLHARGFVHCDIKPDNIVMKSKLSDAAPCIIDFDCSRTAKEGAQAIVSTTTKHLSGTLAFVAPEVFDCVAKGKASNLEAIRSPAIDMYALGRTLVMLICTTDLADPNMGEAIFEENDNDTATKFVIPTDEDESRLGAALAPVAEKLEQLINNELLCVDPTKRTSAMKAQEVLEGLRRELVATREEAVAVAQAPGQCCICSRQVYVMELVRCNGTTNEDRVGSSSDGQHAYCAECLVPMISSWSHEPLAIHVQRGGKIVCGYGECCGELNATEVVRLGGAEVQEQIMRVMVQTGESAAATQLKEQAEHQSLQQRAVLHVDEEILAVRCPKCKARFAINFDECLALKCSQCRTHFCGYCGTDCGPDAHSHITQKQCPALKHYAMYGSEPGLFTKAPQWRKVWVEYHRKELDAYLSRLPQEVKDNVVVQCDL